ncbi:MAG: serine acetyltransferase [Acidobacteria bacterium]|nr:serine acetyltransferase [Acidobacteriota bacterium]
MSKSKNNLNTKELKEISLKIVESYGSKDPFIEQLNRSRLPSRETIITVLASVQELIFPGYFGILGLDESNIAARTYNLVSSLFEDICSQISLCLRLEGENKTFSDLQNSAEKLAITFIEGIPRLRGDMSLDVEAAYVGDPAAHSYDEIIFSYPGIYSIMVYRIANSLALLGVPLIPRIMTEHAHNLTGIDIHPNATIGNSFFIDHGTGVVIGETTTIGNNVKIYQGVTLGALSLPTTSEGVLIRGTKRHPTIEDNVVIYSGATILGGDTVIGKGSVIGGNVWLTHSVPPHSKVLMEDPKIRIRQSTTLKAITESDIEKQS